MIGGRSDIVQLFNYIILFYLLRPYLMVFLCIFNYNFTAIVIVKCIDIRGVKYNVNMFCTCHLIDTTVEVSDFTLYKYIQISKYITHTF